MKKILAILFCFAFINSLLAQTVVRRPIVASSGCSATTKADDFTETSDTALASHTPTGSNAGAGWTQISGAIQVIGSSDRAQDNNASSGNRAVMNNDLGCLYMDVQADMTWIDTGNFTSLILIGGANSGLTGNHIEAGWDENNGSHQFFINDQGGGNSSTAAESVYNTGETHTLKLEIRPTYARLYCDGVQKVEITTYNVSSTNHYAGVGLLTFSPSSNRLACDNWTATSVP